jgi:hypothetical protein
MRSRKALPLGARKHHQATMGVFGDGELTSRSGAQNLAVTRRHRQAAFGVQTQRRCTLKHLILNSCLNNNCNLGISPT